MQHITKKNRVHQNIFQLYFLLGDFSHYQLHIFDTATQHIIHSMYSVCMLPTLIMNKTESRALKL